MKTYTEDDMRKAFEAGQKQREGAWRGGFSNSLGINTDAIKDANMTFESWLNETYPDLTTRESKINDIRHIILNYESTSSAELGLDASPCISSIGNGKNNVCQLAERFLYSGVEAITYNDEIEIGSELIPYEELSDELINEIHKIILDYEEEMKEEN